MRTTFDFASLLTFGVLAAVYLHRSAQDAKDPIPLWAYALAAAGCAVGDVIANRGHVVVGAILLVAALVGTITIAQLGRTPKQG